MRALIQKECLESLQCTYNNSSELSVNKLATEEVKSDDDIFGQIDDLTSGQKQLRIKQKPMVVLDAQNIAMRHGVDQKFSCRGI